MIKDFIKDELEKLLIICAKEKCTSLKIDINVLGFSKPFNKEKLIIELVKWSRENSIKTTIFNDLVTINWSKGND